MEQTNKSKDQKQAQKNTFFQKSLSVRSRFLIGAAVALLLICFIGAYWFYQRERKQLEEYAYDKTQLVMAAVEASREYVREDLRPKMYEEFGNDYFLLQAMSTSYVGRAVMENFNQVLPQYEYRRVAQNARNPDSEANHLELSLINQFRQHPELQNWQGMLKVHGQKQFMRFKPVYFQESCMSCHGDPLDAPQDLVQRYGTKLGFGNQPGELAGVVAVGIPVQSALAEIKDRAASVFFALFLGALLFYMALAIIFNRVVVNNLRGVLSVFKEEITEKRLQDFMPETDPNGNRDELQELTAAAVTMSEHLRRSQQELKQYAQNLEQKVNERTKALQDSKFLLQQQVQTRNKELQALNRISELTTQAVGLQEVWRRVLEQSLELIPARGAGVFIYQQEEDLLDLQFQHNALQLPVAVLVQESCTNSTVQKDFDLSESICLALSGQLSIVAMSGGSSCLNIPMSCRGRVLGVLSFIDLEQETLSHEQQELLLSIGRQVGIAVESLNDLYRLAQSKELLQTVLDGITDLLMLLDSEFRIKMVNKAYLHRYGVQFADILDRPCFEVHAGLMESCPNCALSEVIQNAVPSSKELTCATGEVFLIHFYPILDEAGAVEHVIRYAREITEQKKMEQKIQQTEKLVALGQLASGVAHEINNPLGIILCYVDLLKRQLANFPQGLKDLSVIEKQTMNCKNIVTDLLQFSRNQESAKVIVQPNTIVQEAAQMFRHKLQKSNIQLQLDLDPDLPDIRLNPDKVKQVLVNLLMNSLQAVSEHGSINVSSGHDPKQGTLWISVWDNGQGIDSSIRSKIFDPFFSTKQTGEGTGLGLAVSYGIIQDHGGEVTLQSEKNAWTRFTIVLPLFSKLDDTEHHV